ncbi:hypothetical protein AK812_SmicGene43122 [Symbiodinium microadriaticum]|uniref:Uncharacterized protein n=1 Tax=Symbiodinium microadriaticum TaxID=2951 RepID=A0A1Q9C1T8_SYMMI|nr:hypothetical protein AK812_SmicGene43122 [Symbiodinium microadriaticum]
MRVLAVTCVDPSPLSDALVMPFGFKEAEYWAHGRKQSPFDAGLTVPAFCNCFEQEDAPMWHDDKVCVGQGLAATVTSGDEKPMATDNARRLNAHSSMTRLDGDVCFEQIQSGRRRDVAAHHGWKSLDGGRVLAVTAVDPSPLSDVLVMHLGFNEAECWAYPTCVLMPRSSTAAKSQEGFCIRGKASTEFDSATGLFQHISTRKAWDLSIASRNGRKLEAVDLLESAAFRRLSAASASLLAERTSHALEAVGVSAGPGTVNRRGINASLKSAAETDPGWLLRVADEPGMPQISARGCRESQLGASCGKQ